MASSKEFKKMGSSNPALEVSVSFGRFENDSLSWEKWSTFSPNKYLEEVEKCATPGSVAQKKAYFEEHYKKIAARKAELLAQDKPDEGDPVHKSNGHDEADNQEINLSSEVNDVRRDEPNQEPGIAKKSPDLWVEELKERISSMVENEEKMVESPELNKPEETAPEEAFLVKKEMETPSKGSQDVMELSQRSENVVESIPKIKDRNLKSDQSAKSKITAVSKERKDSRAKKKPASPVTKTPQVSTSRASKTTLTSTSSSAPRTRSKAGTTLSYSSNKTKSSSVEQGKKVAPRSLHMSLSLDPSSPGPAAPPATAATRKSLFMEKMGDKDIVKRAFKTFQSNLNQVKPSSQEQSAAAKPASAKGRESRVPTLTTPQKENGGSSKVSSMEKKNAKAAPSYSGLRSDEKAERKKEFSKKPEGKSNDREAARRHLQTKSKDNRDAEIKKLGQSLNFKATPLPGFYHGQRTSKIPLDKIGSKSDIHR